MIESKHLSLMLLLLVMVLSLAAASDINQDKTEYSNELVGLVPCLPYVGGSTKDPTIDCCSGLKQVLDKSKKCLCVLIKDRDDPSLGLNINATLAATLPATCRAPLNMTHCISLLHLTPNSTEANLFEGYQKLTEGHHAAAADIASENSSSSAAAAEKSDGMKTVRWVGVEMAFGVLLCITTIYHNLLCVM